MPTDAVVVDMGASQPPYGPANAVSKCVIYKSVILGPVVGTAGGNQDGLVEATYFSFKPAGTPQAFDPTRIEGFLLNMVDGRVNNVGDPPGCANSDPLGDRLVIGLGH